MQYYQRYFKIIPQNKQDAERLKYILTSRIFFPTASSIPPLPVVYDNTFDYRQFFKVLSFYNDGTALIFTRSQYDVITFETNVIPTVDWQTRYGLIADPIIQAADDYTEILQNGIKTTTSINTFLTWNYLPHNNDIGR